MSLPEFKQLLIASLLALIVGIITQLVRHWLELSRDRRADHPADDTDPDNG